MLFLENISIKAKIIMLVIPICLIGITGLTFVSLKYRFASQAYVNFIAQDEAAAIQMARASQRLTALSYNAYQVLSYETDDPNIKKFALYYDSNKSRLVTELKNVRALVPAQQNSIESFIAAASNILSLTNVAVQQALEGDDASSRATLRKADPLIADQVLQIRSWIESFTKATDSKSNELALSAEQTSLYALVTITALFAIMLAASIRISSRHITRPLVRLRDRMALLAEGDTDGVIPGDSRKDELGSMARAVSVFRANAVDRVRLENETEVSRAASETERNERAVREATAAAETNAAVQTLGAALQRLSEGNILHRIDLAFRTDLDPLRTDFNASMDKLLSALLSINENARRIDQGCSEIRSASHDLSIRTERQAASLEETARAVGQVSGTLRDSAARAADAKVLVAQASQGAQSSGLVVRSAIEAMKNIEKSSAEITNIIGVIDEIAFQTNLLALNAGVEASRAGRRAEGSRWSRKR